MSLETLRSSMEEMNGILSGDLRVTFIESLQTKFGDFVESLLEQIRNIPVVEPAGVIPTIYYQWLHVNWLTPALEFNWCEFLTTPGDVMVELSRMDLPVQLRELWHEYQLYLRLKQDTMRQICTILGRPSCPNLRDIGYTGIMDTD